jgi:uncharacterized protein with FMN-binding domain
MKEKKNISIKKVVLFAGLGILLIALAFGINYYVTFLNYERDVAAIKVQNVDLNSIEDGEYFGDCDVDFIRAKIRIVVQDHIITDLELLEHYNDRGGAADALPARILKEQRIDVDVISGATASSHVIQEAIYNALTGNRTIRMD